jgi:hypothetical protein
LAKGKKKKNKMKPDQKPLSGVKKGIFILALILIVPVSLLGIELIMNISDQGINTNPFHKVALEPRPLPR